ncbi:MbcA/ParS/Xre antitoxin family protein [Sphingomonas sp. LY54]|uniref:MbcA/ParS/Xre antitoxin family protein n=1 Tax=Sphingomonas sp. LY54 TaxID=3095343 RepID=UPI003A7F163F
MENTARDAADILALVEPRFGSTERARHWFETEPLPGFGGRTAKQLVTAGRAGEVREFMAAIDAGIHS